MARIDYYHEHGAPRANSLVPGASAVVTDRAGAILLQRRTDSGLWALPGGVMDIGESIGQTIVREVHEETGLEVAIDYIVGVYSDPGHVFAYDDGEVRQQFSICFACSITGGELRASDESTDIGFFRPDQLAGLEIHPSIRQRVADFFAGRRAVVA